MPDAKRLCPEGKSKLPILSTQALYLSLHFTQLNHLVP
jgi:hypothetical protein